jgi:hypothetical protein
MLVQRLSRPQRASAGHREPASSPRVPASEIGAVLRTSGEPLKEPARGFFADQFGYDFSHVRIHTDARAAASADALDARAYTVGNDIVLGRGEYAPASQTGRTLLAHELAHVVQQRNATAPNDASFTRRRPSRPRRSHKRFTPGPASSTRPIIGRRLRATTEANGLARISL